MCFSEEKSIFAHRHCHNVTEVAEPTSSPIPNIITDNVIWCTPNHCNRCHGIPSRRRRRSLQHSEPGSILRKRKNSFSNSKIYLLKSPSGGGGVIYYAGELVSLMNFNSDIRLFFFSLSPSLCLVPVDEVQVKGFGLHGGSGATTTVSL